MFALLVIDMQQDNIYGNFSVGENGKKIIPKIQRVLKSCRKSKIPVIYTCDSFLENDFIFDSKIIPHCIRNTEGSKVIKELEPKNQDLVLEKRRFSAFFKTDLDLVLRELEVETVVLTGVSTGVCVLLTALDAVCNNFRVIILEDCCASHKKDWHDAILKYYGGFSKIRVMNSLEFLGRLNEEKNSVL